MIKGRHNFVVIGMDEKEGRRIGGRRNVIRSARINRRGKIGAAVRIMMKGDGSGDVTASREAKYSDTILRKAPFGSARAYEADGLLAVGDGKRDNGPAALRHFRRIVCVRVTGAHHAIFEDKRRHADGIQPVRELDAFMGDPEFPKTAAGQMITAVPVAREGSGK